MSTPKTKSSEAKKEGNAFPIEPTKHVTPLSALARQYLELLPSETNVVAAATMAPRSSKFEPSKLLSQVEKIKEAEKLRVMDCRRSLAHEMELNELESLLIHLGCSEPCRGYPLDDPIWRDPIVAPALHVYQESRRADDDPVVSDKEQKTRLILEMHEHLCGLTRPEFPCTIDDALRYCSSTDSQSIPPLKQAFKDLQAYSKRELSNGRSITRNHPLRKKHTSLPLPTSFLPSNWMEKFAEDSILTYDEAELATLLLHFGNFWALAQSHYLAEHEAKREADSRRAAALKKTRNAGVNNRERGRWLKCAKAFAKQHRKTIPAGVDNYSEVISIIKNFTTEYCSNNGAPDGDLVKALFRTILGAKDDLDVTPGTIKQQAIESLGKRNSTPFKALTDEAIQEIADIISRSRNLRPSNQSAPSKAHPKAD